MRLLSSTRLELGRPGHSCIQKSLHELFKTLPRHEQHVQEHGSMHANKCFSTSCSAGSLSWAHTRQPGAHWLCTFKQQRPQSWASCVCADGDGCWPGLLTVIGAARRSLPPSPSCWACRCRCQPPRSECKQQGAEKHPNEVSRLWCHVQLL